MTRPGQAPQANERLNAGVVQAGGAHGSMPPLRAAQQEEVKRSLVLGPEVEDWTAMPKFATPRVHRDQAKGRQGAGGLVVGIFRRRVMVGTGQFPAREQARRLR